MSQYGYKTSTTNREMLKKYKKHFVAFMPMPKPLDYNCLVTCLHSQDISYTEPVEGHG